MANKNFSVKNGVNVGQAGPNAGFMDITANSIVGGYLWANHFNDGTDKNAIAGYSPLIQLRTDTGALVFYTSSLNSAGSTLSVTERMRIDTSGNVGIGTSTLGSKLDVSGLTRASGFGFNATGGSVSTGIAAPAADTLGLYTNTIERVRIDASGNLGLGVTPSYKLDVAGMIRTSSGGYRFPDDTVQTTAGVAPSSNTYVGTTAIALNRASAAQALTGITSIDGSAAKITTARTIAATGDASWSVSFDGSANATAAITIASSAVTNAKMANMAAHTFKGNNTGAAAAPIDLTATQLTAELNTFSTALKGLAPASGGGTANFLRADGTWAAPPSGSGTVTSIAVSGSSALAVSGSPITTFGTIALTLDADLEAIAALAGTTGFLKKTAANTWSLDTSTYITGNQTITVSGDATGSGSTSIALTLANSGVSAGTYKSVTVDAKGRVTAGTNPTTLSGYGITDAVLKSGDTMTGALLVNNATQIIGSNSALGILYLGGGWQYGITMKAATDVTTAINFMNAAGLSVGNISQTATGVTFSGIAASASTLANSRNIAGVAFNGTADINIPFANLSSKPTTVSGYGITDALLKTGDTMTGVLVTGAAFRETRVAIAASNIDLATASFFTKTISGATTFTVSNTAASGLSTSFILDLTNGGSAAITWWAGVKWAGGTAPTLTSSGRDVLGFFTHNGGTTWTGLLLGKDVK